MGFAGLKVSPQGLRRGPQGVRGGFAGGTPRADWRSPHSPQMTLPAELWRVLAAALVDGVIDLPAARASAFEGTPVDNPPIRILRPSDGTPPTTLRLYDHPL